MSVHKELCMAILSVHSYTQCSNTNEINSTLYFAQLNVIYLVKAPIVSNFAIKFKTIACNVILPGHAKLTISPLIKLVDINECSAGSSDCDDRCHNTAGSYYCSCSRSGYRLMSDGTSCRSELAHSHA